MENKTRARLLSLMPALVLIHLSFAVPVRARDVRLNAEGERFYVYKDSASEKNNAEWQGWMPAWSGEMLQLALDDRSDPASGSSAVRVDVKFCHAWAGIAVMPDSCGWGDHPCPGFDLTRGGKQMKLVFYAKGRRGGETIRVKVGITGDKPHGDSTPFPAGTPWIKLTNEWRRYELKLKGYDLRRVITPFVFVTDRAHNSGVEEMTSFFR